ncbi:uncharacterized protein LOC117321007 [Pecten maximus]|uniref:uncharacterized protein LOC117316636 n=1 Tax=Pecten maximus TaxID=6579 RepID=UPI001458E0C8|nr:uncharacterized protein LOC117316636 [Pecten maximus]XP_033731378.1 uncharacterized protein LOC117321006 [Pecten maximus]XP_033731379.1 uncharacterized protein LOC117321007 [Pecten maximus]
MGSNKSLDWIVDLDNAHDPKYGEPFQVPIVAATNENFKEYGNLVTDFDAEEVEIVPWPVMGRRPLCNGTGIFGGVAEGDFLHEWVGDKCKATSTAIGWGVDSDFFICRLGKGVDPDHKTRVLVREANNHPDGSQCFFPKEKLPFVALFALPGDDVKLEDFMAFYSDGSFGFHIRPNVWHQPMIPVSQKAVFRNKQGAVHACVGLDTVNEFGRFLSVPLKIHKAE